MGLAMWIVAGVAVAAAARLIAPGRPSKWLGEATLAVVTGFVLGIVATALDFGGWKEPDWRAGLFALFSAAAVIGLIRVFRLTR